MRTGTAILIFISVYFGYATTVFGQTTGVLDDDVIIRVGPFDHENIDPASIFYKYRSTFKANVEYRIEHDFKKNSFRLFRGEEEISPKDPVLSGLMISHHPYTLEEYIYTDSYGGESKRSAEKSICLILKFNVFNHDVVVQGHYEICEGYDPTLYLYRSAGFGRLDSVYLGEGEILGPDEYEEYGAELNSSDFGFID